MDVDQPGPGPEPGPGPGPRPVSDITLDHFNMKFLLNNIIGHDFIHDFNTGSQIK